ncbi:hypothetical protein H5410_047251 [Solanum commersonii]|uniref:Uncharacterized protein n=1 Tax=Solanum commersonii TaxID=4109 RepID=A0A9J5XEJ5_SOLCO|nr:hypothetical protein H5410_047251 [Solanum commersonii]
MEMNFFTKFVPKDDKVRMDLKDVMAIKRVTYGGFGIEKSSPINENIPCPQETSSTKKDSINLLNVRIVFREKYRHHEYKDKVFREKFRHNV